MLRMKEKDLLESFAAELAAFSPLKLDQMQKSPEDTFAVFTQAILALKTDRRKIGKGTLFNTFNVNLKTQFFIKLIE